MARVYLKTPAIDRLLSRIEINSNGCWVWTGAKDKLGYGRINVNGKAHLTHRVTFLHFKGQIPEANELDHLCRNPSCANPEHLEYVTRKINTDRGMCAEVHKERAKNRLQCKNGHKYSEDNIYIDTKGKRNCRQCRKDAFARFKKKKAHHGS